MKRRQFIGLLGGAAVVATSSARAQQQPIPVIGFLNGASADGYALMVVAFREGLRQIGYVEGRNVAIEFRWADGHYDRLPAMAADLVRRQVSVIAATSTPANLIAKAATGTIPIVFTTAGDPVQLGLIASLSRPGGNVTGVTQLNVEVSPKRLELARELMPGVAAVALLVNPANPSGETISKNMQAVAEAIGLQLLVLHASSESELQNAFADVHKLGAGVLVIGADAFFNDKNQLLAELSLRHAVPAIFHYPEFTVAGGLMSYGGSIRESYRTAGVLAGRILKGEKPADLPVQQSTTVELIINLKSAKALGITVPLSLLGRADHVIE
jgi:putative ABC transport system substrate-binding protein